EWVADLGSAGSSIGARFSPDGSRIAAGSADGPIRIFDATTGVVMATLIGHEGQVPDVRWMTDGNLVSIGHSFLGDGTVRVWNGDSGELLETWTGVDPTNLDVSPDGSLVATSAPFTGEIKVLNRGTGEVRTIATVPFPVGIAFDPVDGSRLAVGSFEFAEKGGGLIVLDPLSGEELLRVPVAGGACDAAWSPDGALIGVAGEGDSVLDAATGAEVAAFNGHHSNSCSINFSVDGELVVTGGDDAAPRVWEATTGREVLPLPGHTERVGFVSFSPDGSRVLSTSPDGTLRVWDVRPEGRRESIAVHDPSITVDAIYLDGTDLFLSGSRSGAAGVWSRIDGTLRREYEANIRLFAVTASPAADLAVTGSLDGTIALWSITTGENVRRIQLGVPINGLAMSADGRLLGYTAGDLFAGESVAYLVNPATGEEIPLQGAGEFAAWLVSISPDGTRFAAGNGSLIKLWDLASGESVRTIDTGNQSIWAGILSLTFDDSGERIIVTTQAGPVAIFDSASGELLQTFIGHAGVVVDAALTPDGTLLASVGGDGTIRLWDVQTGEETLRIQEPKLLTSVDFSEDGSQLLVAGEFGARVYEVETDNLFDLARSRLLRWWTTDECFQYLGTSECPEPASG
ncbi:MAG: WD40 repeat domain-containing protein, partial [Acidimicrobiia bacterium]